MDVRGPRRATKFSEQHTGEFLRIARNRSGLTQAQVAQRLGMRRPSISEIERGRRHVKAHELEAMASLYRVSTRFLMYGAGPKDGQLVGLVAEELALLTDADLDRLVRAIGIAKRRRR